MKYLAALLLALMPSLVMAQTAIVFEYDPASTLYARLYTSTSAAVAVAFTPGSGGNARYYSISQSDLTNAGLSPTTTAYAFTVFTGSPSTSASDPPVGAGVTAVPVANQVWSASLAGYTASGGTMGQALDWLKETFQSRGVFDPPALANAPAGEGGGGIVIPVNQVPVPESRTFRLAATSDGLVGDFPKGLDLNEPEVFALNFAADLATNGRIVGIDSVRIVSVDGVAAGEDEAGLTWNLDDVDDAGVDKMLAKLRLTAVEAGLYELEVKANRSPQDGGGLSKARVWFDAD